MSEDALSPEVKSFIAEQIDSVVQVEILQMMLERRGQEILADETAKALRINSAWAGEQLNNLCARGILVCDDQAARRYRYQPVDEKLDRLVQELVKAYTDRRVTVINLIYAKPIDKIKSFADAFRIRRERPNG